MQFVVLSILACAALHVDGFKMPSVRSVGSAPTALNALQHMERLDNTLTSRVVLETLPIVYVYDHCPFCVRVRLALGLKNIKHEVRYLANDDIATPTSLVGKKIAPIFSMAGSIEPMLESLDIIAKIDSDPAFGPVGFFKPTSGRVDIKAWMKTVADANRVLQRPRYMLTMLPEFANFDGRLWGG
jgi:glutaredoxin 2